MWPEILLKSMNVSMLVPVVLMSLYIQALQGGISSVQVGSLDWSVMPLKRTNFC